MFRKRYCPALWRFNRDFVIIRYLVIRRISLVLPKLLSVVIQVGVRLLRLPSIRGARIPSTVFLDDPHARRPGSACPQAHPQPGP
ncbi:hypothetical protein EMIT0P12_30632 [Pseudomonas sp. IT-P12]